MSRGIYGVYIGKELVYVGQTTRDFRERWKEHISYVENPELKSSQQNFLYKAIRNADAEVSFKALVSFEGKVSKSQLDAMEYALITSNSPKFNYQGLLAPYPGVKEYNNSKTSMKYNYADKKQDCIDIIKKYDEMIDVYHSLGEEAKQYEMNIKSYNTCKRLKAEWESKLSLME